MRKPTNSGKEWVKTEIQKLKNMAKQGKDTDEIAEKLKRTKNAVYKKASEKSITLKPKDKNNR